MPDWTRSMVQTFEYFKVDPITWADVELLTNVRSCKITRDYQTETLGSATFEIDGDFVEMYVRVYLVTIQNGVRERFPLGTFLLQSPSTEYTSTIKKIKVDAYTPLLELKENKPPIGYTLKRGTNITETVRMLVEDNSRCKISYTRNDVKLASDFVANSNDTWLKFITDLLSIAKYTLALDMYGKIFYRPITTNSSSGSKWTYRDDETSIIDSDISIDNDIFGIPNVVEINASYAGGGAFYRAINDRESSPTSTVNRGRKIIYRETNPREIGLVTKAAVQEYATRKLEELSTITKIISYTHGYCPVSIGDTITMNHSKYGIFNLNAQVLSQDIECIPGTPVTEVALYSEKLWKA